MRRPTSILLILFILFGVLVWYMQNPENPIKRALATSTTVYTGPSIPLINPVKGPISRLSIQDAAGKTVTIEKSYGNKWSVSAGYTALADQNLAESASVQVLSLPIVTKLEKAPDPAGTGLDKPAYTISLVLTDGSPYVFKIGKVTVTGSGYYAETPDGTVYVVSKVEVDTLLQYFSTPPFLQTATPSAAAPTGTPTPTKAP